MKINFTETAWKEYTSWQTQDKKTIKRINQLIKDIDSNHNEGILMCTPCLEQLKNY